jgi:hypothetical protein
LGLRFQHFVDHRPDLGQGADCAGERVQHDGVVNGIQAPRQGGSAIISWTLMLVMGGPPPCCDENIFLRAGMGD